MRYASVVIWAGRMIGRRGKHNRKLKPSFVVPEFSEHQHIREEKKSQRIIAIVRIFGEKTGIRYIRRWLDVSPKEPVPDCQSGAKITPTADVMLLFPGVMSEMHSRSNKH